MENSFESKKKKKRHLIFEPIQQTSTEVWFCHVGETSLESLFLTTREKTRCVLVQNATWQQSRKLANRGKKLDLWALLHFREEQLVGKAWDCLVLSWLDAAAAAGRQTVAWRLQSDANITVSRIETSRVAFPAFHSCPVRSLVLWFSMFESLLDPKNRGAVFKLLYCFWLLVLLVSEDSSLWVWLFWCYVAAEYNAILSIMILYEAEARPALSLWCILKNCWRIRLIHLL